jgi:hypothetical protein
VISTGVRLHRFTVLTVLLGAACSAPAPAPPRSTSAPVTTGSIHVEPANIRRLRGAFPPGYEVSEIRGTASPAKFWGLRPGWSSEPAQCASLADPAADDAPAPVGLSGSGNGGIIYVAVAAGRSGPDPHTVDSCSHWSMDSGRTTAVVNRFDAAAIDGLPTIGMVSAIRTIVEGGNETDLRATTVTAYLGTYVAFVTVVVDPGSGPSQLPPDLASTFLAKAVAVLRG